MNDNTSPSITAMGHRLQAMALLTQAAEIDGLRPHAVHHRHAYGSSSYLLWSAQTPGETLARQVLAAPFEPDRGEEIAVDTLTLDELVGLAHRTGEGPRALRSAEQTETQPAGWMSTPGHPVDPQEVAAWVQEHYSLDLHAEPNRRQEWVDRFVAADPDRFPTYLVYQLRPEGAPPAANLRWVYRLGGTKEGLVVGHRQEACGTWILLNRTESRRLAATVRDVGIDASMVLPAYWEGTLKTMTALPVWANLRQFESTSEALNALCTDKTVGAAVTTCTSWLLGNAPAGDASLTAWQRLMRTLNTPSAPAAARAVGATIDHCNTLQDLIGREEAWQHLINDEVAEARLGTVLATECIRTYLRVEWLIRTFAEPDEFFQQACRRNAAAQMDRLARD